MQPVVYAADIGSIAQRNFGWARVDPERGDIEVERDHGGGAEIVDLVAAVERDLERGRPVALGFECPLFVPVPTNPQWLGKAREGEGSRSFSAGAGTGALVTGLVEVAWVLRAVRERRSDDVAFLDWGNFAAAGRGLFLWEAFVSGAGKGASHVDDAQIAATAFCAALPDPWNVNAITASEPLSLIGAALLWSGWSQDLTLMHESCLVIKAKPVADVKHPVGKAGRSAKLSSSTIAKSSPRLHDWVVRVAEQIPRGRWTTYGTIAEIIKGDPDAPFEPAAISVGNELMNDPDIPNAHRILNARGRIPEGFPYPPGLIKGESIRFTNGRADPQKRWPTPGS